MRNALIAVLAAASLAPAFAAENAGKPAADENPAFAKLPDNVKSAAKKQIQDGKITSVEEVEQGKKKAYDISFTGHDGKAHKIEVTESGSVVNKDEQKDEKKHEKK